jgi:hypothetical protein
MKQIGKKYNRQEVLRASTNSSEAHETREAKSKSLAEHHVISECRNLPIPLFNFVQTNSKDPAVKVWTTSYPSLSVAATKNSAGLYLKAQGSSPRTNSQA